MSPTGVAKKGRSHPASGSVPEALTCCCLRSFAQHLSRLSSVHEGGGKAAVRPLRLSKAPVLMGILLDYILERRQYLEAVLLIQALIRPSRLR